MQVHWRGKRAQVQADHGFLEPDSRCNHYVRHGGPVSHWTFKGFGAKAGRLNGWIVAQSEWGLNSCWSVWYLTPANKNFLPTAGRFFHACGAVCATGATLRRGACGYIDCFIGHAFSSIAFQSQTCVVSKNRPAS